LHSPQLHTCDTNGTKCASWSESWTGRERPWARELFVPHQGHILVGADLEQLELRALGHYLARFDNGAYADVLLNGDIHQQNADQKLGHSFHPELSDAQKKQLGQELRRKFLDAIPGLEPLINAVKERVRGCGRLRALDGRPVFCTAEHASLNYLLQSAGAIISKRWVVIGQELLDAAGLTYDSDYTRCAYVHDEVQLSVVPSEVDRVKHLLEAAAPKAGDYYNFRVPITAAADHGNNWASTH
jgi:DNA polymerase I-like protein with 3'-5' exonuclease and polymerase domains